jgi:phage terminase small subunit
LSAIYDDPAVFLKAVMNDSGSDAKLRVDAAKALLRERGEIGKKEQQQQAARKIASKFAAATPPKLIVNNK